MHSAAVNAQTERMIKWQAVYGAGGYVIEIKDSDGVIIIEKEVISTSYDISKFNSGKYTYRITTLNKLKQRGRSTSWIGFTVEKAVIPEIKSISHSMLAWSYDNPEIVVKGSSFNDKTKIYLRKGSLSIETDRKYISDSEIIFKYNPDSDEEGVYDIAAVNENGFEAVLQKAIEITAPDIPVVDSLSVYRIFHSTRSELTIRGSNLGAGSEPLIEDEAGKRLQVKFRNVSDNEITVSIDATASEKGNYIVKVLRKDFFISEKKFRLEIADPQNGNIALVKDSGAGKDLKENTVKGDQSGDIYLGISWEYNMPLGEWGDELQDSITGVDIYFAYQIKGLSFFNSIPFVRNLEIDGVAGYSRFALVSGLDDEYYSIMDMTLGLNCPLFLSFLNGRLFPLLTINSGIAYSTIKISNYTGSHSYSSFDQVLYSGLSLRYKPESFFIDLSCGWQRIFYVSKPMDDVKFSLRAGIVF